MNFFFFFLPLAEIQTSANLFSAGTDPMKILKGKTNINNNHVKLFTVATGCNVNNNLSH